MFCDTQCRCHVCGRRTFLKDEGSERCVCWEHAPVGVLERALAPFPEAMELYRAART